MKIELYGNHQFISIDQVQKIIEEFETIFHKNTKDSIVEIEFVDKDKIQKLNKIYRKIDKPTDVLSFPQDNIPGDNKIFGTIIICREEANNRKEEISELIKHGLLHLLGLDHEKDKDLWLQNAKKINHNMN